MAKDNACSWQIVNGFEDYEVSDTGLVWSRKTNIMLKQIIHTDGYVVVRLYKGGKGSWKYVHKLVANAYVPCVEGKVFVDHIDGVKSNNVVSNLRWCTRSENASFSNCAAKRRKTLQSFKHKMRLYQIGRIYKVKCVETGAVYESLSQAAKAMKIDSSCICVAIKNNRTSCGYHWQRV